MDNATDRIEQLNAMAPDFIRLLGGTIVELDMASQKAVFTFTVPLGTVTQVMLYRVGS